MKRLLLLTTLLSLTSPGLLHADNNVDPEAAVTITGDHVVVNDDDWNNDQIWDKLQGPNPNEPHQPHDETDYENGPLWGGREPSEVAPEPKLVNFTVTAIPTGGTGELTVSKSGGSVKLWTEPNKLTPYVLPVKSDQTSVTFWVEGLEPTASFNEAGFDATYVVTGKDGKTATATAKIRYGITRADIKVDSNNSNSFDDEDEQIEFSPNEEHPGKILLENIGDVDNDGITDNLDGLGLASIGGSSHVENLKLIPMKVKLESPYKPSRAMVTFDYLDSIPRADGDGAGIEKDGALTNGIQKYKIKKRGLRLWKSINEDQSKLFHRSNGNDVTTPGGQFIPANTPIPWTALAPAASAGAEMAREITIYIEYVDLPTNKTYSKEDIIYTIKETNVPENEKGYYLDSLEKKTYLTEKESPDAVCVSLLPVEVVELAPKVKDEAGKEIENSEKPVAFPKYNELVEEIKLENQVDQNRIAHRETKVKIPGGKILAGKKVTWTMKAWGVKEADAVRGDWKHSKVEEHKNRFEESKTYGKYGYMLIDQESSETKIEAMGDDGFTAIRVNLPPIGWNHAEVKIKIEGTGAEMPLIRFIVPAVIVIDPGHGGTESISGSAKLKGLIRGESSHNNAKGGWWRVKKMVNGKLRWVDEKVYEDATGVLEKTLCLEYSQKLREILIAKRDKDNLSLRIYMTRTKDENLGGYERARLARDKGADTFLSIHFNSATSSKTARGALVVVRTNSNNNLKEDQTFANRFPARLAASLLQHDSTAPENPRAQVPASNSMTSDVLGFYQDKQYHPIRSTIVEIEFIHSEGGDKLINGAATKSKILQSATEALLDGLLEELNEFVVQDD